MLKIKKKINSYHIVLMIFGVCSAILSPLLFRASLIRAWDGVKDFAISVAYYFAAIFDYEIPVTVTGFPSLDILDYLPYDFDEIFRRLQAMWRFVFNAECFKAYLQAVSKIIDVIVLLALPLLILIPSISIVVSNIVLEPNTDKHGVRSKHLIRFEGKPLSTLKKVVAWLQGLWNTFVSYKRYLYPITIVWLVNLNIFAIVLEVLAYYFYFAMSQDILNLASIQIGKLLLDLFIMFSSAPFLFWLCAGYTVLYFVRRYLGFEKLDRYEAKNREFIKEQPLGFMACGSMGSKKTTFITDVAISKEIMLRDKAYELLIEQDMKFPNFPWINLEDDITEAMENREIKSLSTCRRYMDNRRAEYEANPMQIKIWDYDVTKYRTTYDDNLRVNQIWDVLKNYAQLYFIYVIQSSLLVANYSIRVDNVLEHAGNFPIWNTELFRRSPEASEAVSRHSHILDYDTLRLGVTMVKDHPNRAAFEFGVVVITEIGKERGNQLTNKGLKIDSEDCNSLNDLFVDWVKLFRHKATVCYYPFVCIICDEQRPESLAADLRELFNIVHIREVEPVRIVMPFYFVEEILHYIIFMMFGKFYLKYRFNRGDLTFFKYVLHNFVAAVHNAHERNKNLFGVSDMILETERGTQDGKMQSSKYYLSEKKTHSDRFATDCFVLYFEDVLLASNVGLEDFPEYEGLEPTKQEYGMQNSNLVSKMEKY